MVEKVVMDMRAYYPNTFDYTQMNNVLNDVKKRMQVDPIS